MTKGKKHMGNAERCRIQFGLEAGESARTIAKEVGVSLSTVTREIAKHTYESFKGCYGRSNQCVRRQECRLTRVCRDCPARGALRGVQLPQLQQVLRKGPVHRLLGPARQDRAGLQRLPRHEGLPQAQARLRRRPGRRRLPQGAERTPPGRGAGGGGAEVPRRPRLPKIRDGQSVHHICVTNAAKLTRNERTIQRYINYGVLSAKRGDLKRACTVRPRKSLAKEYQHKVETGCYVGRTYGDYLKFLACHLGVGPVYMDLVIGRPGGVCLLTLHWLNAGFMVGVLIPNKCAANVTAVFDRLHAELGPGLFAKLFPVVLTDRGTEFSNPPASSSTGTGGAGRGCSSATR